MTIFSPRLIAPAVLAALALPVIGQTEKQSVRGPVTLISRPAIGDHLDAFPRIQPNADVSASVAAKINGSLARLDRNVTAAAADCAKQFREDEHRRSDDTWERSIAISMKGPFFLSVTANDSTNCGGPHPNEAQMPMVYDLTTGRPVDWLALLPKNAKAVLDSSADGITLGLVTWTPLQKLAVEQATDECKEYLDEKDDLPFALSLDAATGSFVATPYGLPHVIAACADAVDIPAEDARKLGFSDRLTTALETAHKLQR